MVSAGPIAQIPGDHQDLFRRVGEMAACTIASRHLREQPAAWPYGRFTVYWLYGEQENDASVLGFGDAADGCSREIAGRWQGDKPGLATAGIPSSDKDEIRVADDTVKALYTAWDARAADAGLDPLGTGTVQLGFDPVEHAMYVWASEDGYGPLGGRTAVPTDGCGGEGRLQEAAGRSEDEQRMAVCPLRRRPALGRQRRDTDHPLRKLSHELTTRVHIEPTGDDRQRACSTSERP